MTSKALPLSHPPGMEGDVVEVFPAKGRDDVKAEEKEERKEAVNPSAQSSLRREGGRPHFTASSSAQPHHVGEGREEKKDLRGEESKLSEMEAARSPSSSPSAFALRPPPLVSVLPSSPPRLEWFHSPPSRSSRSSPSVFSFTLTLAARHLPPSISPVLCLLQSDGLTVRVIAHTEVHPQSMSPAWKKRLIVDWSPGKANQFLQLAVYDASHIQSAAEQSTQRGDEGKEEGDRRSSLFLRLLRRRSVPAREDMGDLKGLQAGELTSDDLVGGVVVDVSALCHSSRHLVTQRLAIRHPSDGEIDRRLHRLSAHLLVTVSLGHSPSHLHIPPHVPSPDGLFAVVRAHVQSPLSRCLSPAVSWRCVLEVSLLFHRKASAPRGFLLPPSPVPRAVVGPTTPAMGPPQ